MRKSTAKDNQSEIPKKKKSVLQEELVVSELQYRRLFKSAKDGILILDAETGKIVDVNPFLIDLLNYSKNEFIEKFIWEIGAFQDIIENKDKFLELQQMEYVRYEDLPLETSDGSKILVEFISNVYLVNNDKVIQCQIRDITARKETEAILEKTRIELAEIKKSADELNKFTENVIDTVREPLLAIDKDLRVIKASRSFYNFFMVTAEETIGKLIYELGNHQWDIPKLRELLEEIIPEKNSFDNYEVEHNFSTIGRRVMLLNARQIKRAFGQEKIILLAIEDITERKGKEDTLKETHRATSDSLNILLNHTHAPIIMWDAFFIIKRFNRKFEQLSGYDSAEVVDKKIDLLFPKDKIAATLELLKNHLTAEQEVVEIDILTKENSIKTVLWSSSRILDEEGKNIIATISQDITSRRQSELALRKSESHLRTLVKTIPDLIWLKDTKGVYLSCNLMFERFFGARETDIIGKTDYDFIDRELADFFLENDRKAMEAGKPTSNEEWVTFADDGHRAFLDTIKTSIYDSDGTLLGVLGIGRDITERKRAEMELIEAKEKAEESDRLKTAFLNNISHEIRTPMNAIVGFSGILNDPGLLPEKRKQFTDMIIQSSDQLLAIIDDIISIASIEAGQ
ncbi:MAG: PAS domain S-box protein, partial [Gracilimonas sp.]